MMNFTHDSGYNAPNNQYFREYINIFVKNDKFTRCHYYCIPFIPHSFAFLSSSASLIARQMKNWFYTVPRAAAGYIRAEMKRKIH